ncbi:glycosyltransferase family 4 protein [Nocardiopsis sp. TNDT3]|uniref:glycosyltransferase family 4 protein n=1 Tax=Nocardiopsis sp. TNDT3 TaxID=2249354 RepID=UPI000E3C813B|nr:glycosyltransferase family 4 protein [Nocardiopsis sp. TNDT3]
MKIAIVHRDLHQLTRGGICTVYRNVAAQLVKQGHQIVFVTQQTPTPLTPMKDVSVVVLPRTNDLPAHRRAVDEALNRIEVDIVEASSWEAEVHDYAMRPLHQRVPVVVRADLSARTMGLSVHAEFEDRLIRAAEAVTAVGRWTGEDILSAYGVRAEVIPNGVDRDFFRPGPAFCPLHSGNIVDLKAREPERGKVTSSRSIAEHAPDTDTLWNRLAGPGEEGLPRVVWVGKATEMKGWDLLQQVAAVFRGKALFTVVIGHGWFEYDITLGHEPHVQTLQDLDASDLLAVYRSSDWVLSTSRWEGFHLSFAEALSCEVPGLAPEHLGAAHDLLTHGRNGLFYRDAEHLVELMASGVELRGSLAPEFDWAANASQSARLYTRILTEKGQN